MPDQTFVKCRVSTGFFKTEYYVVLPNGSAYFVDRGTVNVPSVPDITAVEGKVLAYVIEENLNNQVLIELTGEPVVDGLRTWVSKDELEHVAA